MREVTSDRAVEIRRYTDRDESAVLALLRATLGEGPIGERSHEFFRWKHVANPFGRSFMLVAELDGMVVGLRAFLRWRFHANGNTIPAVNAVDTATHPEYQRLGIFSRLTRAALEEIRREGGFVYNTPNERSLPGYLKMGWKRVASIPIYVRVARPLRFSRGLRGVDQSFKGGEAPTVTAPNLSEALSDSAGLSALLEEDAETDGRLRTQRSLEYLAWRYERIPRLDYRAVSRWGQQLKGLAIFRVRARGRLWEATVSELFVRPGDHGTARRLLQDIRRSVRVDHLTCHFPRGSTAVRAARRGGFLRSPRGVTFVANDLGQELHPDPRSFGSWALSLGDLEVF